ncbi:hypothetical protein SI65_06639 [Aspergillus cristatus]|uniref:Uncharacterized protein n=1 Tax=Aspergillus cristatus TaxID=573508 RepID=A0A1E3BAQ1_ASPCR|nr:hypothetical protein SI65_06639 [Aspergillus cristatus]
MRTPSFQEHIEVIVAREHSYKHKYAILFFFEENDFGVTVTILKIAAGDRTPAETLQNTINQTVDMIGPCGDEVERSLIIIVYIGEAVVDDGHILFSTFTFRQAIFWDTIREALFTGIEKLNHIDALGLIDCCSVLEITVQTSRKCQRGSAQTTVDSLFEEMQHQGSNPCGDVSELVLCQISGDKPISLRFKQSLMTRELQEELDGVRGNIEGVSRITMPDEAAAPASFTVSIVDKDGNKVF